jgi:signal recognition particle GTPase
MLNGVGGEVDGADIVTVDEAGRIQRVVQLLQELP